MIVTAFLSWWYGTGWRLVGTQTLKQMQATLASFSVPSIVRTMFAPWRRIITPPGRNIKERFQAAVDNGFSRCIGFVIRLSVLIAGCVMIMAIGLIGLLKLILWPLLPPAVIVLLVRSVF